MIKVAIVRVMSRAHSAHGLRYVGQLVDSLDDGGRQEQDSFDPQFRRKHFAEDARSHRPQHIRRQHPQSAFRRSVIINSIIVIIIIIIIIIIVKISTTIPAPPVVRLEEAPRQTADDAHLPPLKVSAVVAVQVWWGVEGQHDAPVRACGGKTAAEEERTRVGERCVCEAEHLRRRQRLGHHGREARGVLGGRKFRRPLHLGHSFLLQPPPPPVCRLELQPPGRDEGEDRKVREEQKRPQLRP